MKKYILQIGTIATAILPISVVLACSDKTQEEQEKEKKVEGKEDTSGSSNKKGEGEQSFGVLSFLQNKGLKDITPDEIEKILGLLDMASIDLPLEKDQIITIFNNLFQGGGIKGALEDEALQNQLVELAANALVKNDDTSEGYSERKEKVATFIKTLLFEGLGDTKQEAQELILDFLDALKVNIENTAFLSLTIENIIDVVLSYVYNDLEELKSKEGGLAIILENFHLNIFKPVLTKGLLNLGKDNFKQLISFIKSLQSTPLSSLGGVLPTELTKFLDRFQNVDEEQLSSVVNKLLNSGIAEFDTVEDYSQVISFVQILLPFFTEEDSSINKMLKVLQENVYIIKDIIDHGFQSTENATESEKLYLVTQLVGDTKVMGKSIKTLLPAIIGFDENKVQKEDIDTIKDFLETHELINTTEEAKQLYSDLSESIEINDEQIKTFVNIRKSLNSQE